MFDVQSAPPQGISRRAACAAPSGARILTTWFAQPLFAVALFGLVTITSAVGGVSTASNAAAEGPALDGPADAASGGSASDEPALGGSAPEEPASDEPPRVNSMAFSDRARRSLRGGTVGTPRRGGTYTLNVGVQPKTLNNVLRVGHRPGVICREYLFPPLLDLHPDTCELVPELAARRPIPREDGKIWRWTLREGVRWHRGDAEGNPVEVTTRDVRYSWDMIRHPDVLAEHVRSSLDRFVALRVLDEHNFEVEVDRAYFRAEFDFGWEFPIMPAHLAGDDAEAFQADPLGKSPVGYGPYRLERWKPDQHITLVRNEEYWDDERRPFYIERVRFVFVRDTEKVLGMFLRGDLSICTIDNPDRWEAAKEDPKLQERASFHEYYLSRWNFLGWNNDHWAFGDARVRQAMTHLFPREQVCEKFYRGHADVVSGPFGHVTPEYDWSVEPLGSDPGRARELLRAAGFVDHDGDGLLDRDGRTLEFTLLKPSTRVPVLEKAVELFRYHLKRAGVVMNVRPMEFNTLLQKLRAHEFDAAQLGWMPDPRDPDLYPVLHSSSSEGGYNYFSYDSELIDRLLVEYRDELDPTARYAIASKIHHEIQEDHPYTFLPTPQTLLLVSTKFRGVSIHRRGSLIHHWWVADE